MGATMGLPMITGNINKKRGVDKLSEGRKTTKTTPTGKHSCGFCPLTFPSSHELYAHLADEHDPDHIAYSEFGPK